MRILFGIFCVLVASALWGQDEELRKLLEEAKAEAAEAEAQKPRLAPTLTQQRANAFNPAIFVVTDLLGRLDDPDVYHNGDEVGDRFSLRGFEVNFKADVDPFAKAFAVVGYHEHAPGHGHIHIEEAYLHLLRLPAGMGLYLGRFRSHFGMINRLHLHDLPHPTRPLFAETFFGEEGLVFQGGALEWLVLGSGAALRLEVANGENPVLLAGKGSDDLAYTLRARLPLEVGSSCWLQFGANGLFGYNDPQGEHQTRVGGLDFIFSWRPPERGIYRSMFLQIEYLHADIERGATSLNTHPNGGFVMLVARFSRSIYFALRYELSEYPNDDEARFWAAAFAVTYQTSEFLRFRLGFQHSEQFDAAGRHTGNNNSVFLQVVWVFGAHPAEPYWVPR